MRASYINGCEYKGPTIQGGSDMKKVAIAGIRYSIDGCIFTSGDIGGTHA